MGNLAKIFDYVFITRPVLFYPIWTVFLAGHIASEQQNTKTIFGNWESIQLGLSSFIFWVTFVSLSCLMAAVFIINQFTDIHTDKDNNKLFLIANGLVSKRIAVIETIILTCVALSLSLIFKLSLFILLILLFLITGVGYSLPPLLCKDRPYSGLLINLLGGLLTFTVGWMAFGEFSGFTLIRSLPYVFAIGAVYCLTTIPDLKGDKNSGKITIAVRFGTRNTIFIGILFELFCISSSILQKDLVILLPAVLSFIFFLRLIWNQDLRFILQATRFPILLLSISVGIFFPVYFIVMIFIYLLSKWYYMNRFQLNYPSLTKIPEDS